MNIAIVYVDISIPFRQYEKYLPFISEERQEKILQFHFDKDKIISLFTELLIRNEIFKHLDISHSDIMFGYNEYGKPYLLNSLDYHFSVSHSGNCIAFVDSNVLIGIDVKQISGRNLKIAKKFFTANEYSFIKSNKDPITAFYRIWTSKEAYVKMLGLGLNKTFKSFDVFNDLYCCNLIAEQLPEFMLSVCLYNAQSDTVNITVVEQKQLIIDVDQYLNSIT